MELFNTIVLALSGLLLVFAGIMRTLKPIDSYAKNSGIKIDNDINLLNEARGIGSLMFVTGAFVLLGLLTPELARISHFLAALMFLGFLIGRLVGFAIDGKPNPLLVKGIIFEIIFGGLNVFALLQLV